MVQDNPNTENYTKWKNYGFDYVPAVFIKNTSSAKFSMFHYNEISENSIIEAIELLLNNKNTIDKPEDNTSNDQNNEKTPGFEITILLFAVLILFIIRHKIKHF